MTAKENIQVKSWQTGDMVPGFTARSTNNPRFAFESTAGRYLVLCFFGTASVAAAREALAHFARRRDFFNDDRAALFGVSVDAADEATGRVQQSTPGIRHFWDFDGAVSRLYGALTPDGVYCPFTLIIDPMLRVLVQIPLADAAQHNAAFDAFVATLPPVQLHAGIALQAPVLILPRVFEPEFCRELIDLYENNESYDSGFMREIDGKTVGMLDTNFKRRRDFEFDTQEPFRELRARIHGKIGRRLVPQIQKAFQFKVTRLERYIVACYDGQSGGFFRAHRDNTTQGTAHRRFACTINLNAEEYEGGDLRFSEFGDKTYRAPTGGAVIFSCSMLHEATPVTSGKRYAFLPFFYDEEGELLRQKNMAHVVPHGATSNG